MTDAPDPEHTYVGPEYLMNVKDGETEPPFARPWEFYLFCYRDRPNGDPFIHTIKGDSEEQCVDDLRRFVERSDVTLLGDTTEAD